MNLNKKIFIVIVPVIAAFFISAASIVYQTQAQQILHHEKTRLKLAFAELNTLYNQYDSIAENYLISITESQHIKHYLNEPEGPFKHTTLVRYIESKLRSFKKYRSDYLSVTLATTHPNDEILEYIELSKRPYSSIPKELERQALRVLKRPTTEQVQLIINEHAPFLTNSILINAPNPLNPQALENTQTISLSFAIEPTLFLEALTRYQTKLNKKISIRHTPPAPEDTNTVVEKLNDTSYLVSEISVANLSSILFPTRLKLVGVSLLFLVLCSLILYVLMHRTIAGPIKRLEKSIKIARENNSEHIHFKHTSNDEIGRVASEFIELYAQLSQSLKITKELVKLDHLTNQVNLYELKRSFQHRLSRAKTTGETAAFIYIDLDNFKFVNDRYGHDIGDKVLIAFSESIVKLLMQFFINDNSGSPRWQFGRIAGDEFGIVISGSPSKESLQDLSNKIIDLFTNGFQFFHGRYPISASIGISCSPQDGETPSQLISNADTAMYQSKNSGKNTASFFSKEIAQKLRRQRDVENILKSADFDSEFHLVYLPIIDVRELDTYGFEALIRWESPKLGFVGPAEFIPIAESCGLFEKIDAWVMRQSFSEYNAIKNIIDKDFILSVNLSSAQITHLRVHDNIIALSDEFNIDRGHIQIEMTETTEAEFSKGVESLLQPLTEAGFKLAIDDFGTGYTSLQQLVEYPATTIKIDKSFLDATMEQGKRAILKPLVDLCHSQNLAVTVEGVEIQEQFEHMQEIGVDHVQGFLFCKPSSLDELPGALVVLKKKLRRMSSDTEDNT